ADRVREGFRLGALHLFERVQMIVRRRAVFLFRPQLFVIVVVAVHALAAAEELVFLRERRRRGGRHREEGTKNDETAMHGSHQLLLFLRHQRCVGFLGYLKYGSLTGAPLPARMTL